MGNDSFGVIINHLQFVQMAAFNQFSLFPKHWGLGGTLMMGGYKCCRVRRGMSSFISRFGISMTNFSMDI